MKTGYILGYSGLNDYIAYKKANIQGLSEREELVGQGMDAAAALIQNGHIVVAAAEERFTGQKHTGSLPQKAIKACLTAANITINDIDIVAHNFNYQPLAPLFKKNEYSSALYRKILSNERQLELYKETFKVELADKFKAYDHHRCHAAYAYYTSGFSEVLVLVADGLGEYNSISIYKGAGDELSLLKSYGPYSSLGMLYSAITDYLGFLTNSDEYKIMGLAAYGDPKAYRELLAEMLQLHDGGEVFIPNILPKQIKDPLDRETYRYVKQWLATKIFPERQPDEPLTQPHKDLAAALQERLNIAMCHIASYWQQETGMRRLCMSGGVALNCVTNAYIASKHLFDHIYIGPAAADDGTAIGAALLAMIDQGTQLAPEHYVDVPFYGPDITVDASVRQYIERSHLTVREVSDAVLVKEVCKRILKGEIIGWAQGGMEFGPRALGHRSILADPREYAMRERLNAVTKQRENFRPFAPMVKEEALERYFEVVTGVVYKHMLVNVRVRQQYQDRLQAITHVDGTARVQAISRADLPVLWRLLDVVEQHMGIPILLNTSFNLKARPIVCTATDAVQAYIDSDINLLVINNTLLLKQEK